MSEKICPMMSNIQNTNSDVVLCRDGVAWNFECRLWENGDCGLKMAREPLPDRYKEMWEKLRVAVSYDEGALKDARKAAKAIRLLTLMDRIEAEMGKD